MAEGDNEFDLLSSDEPLTEFDKAIADIANRYGVDEERVQSIIEESPTLSTFDPDDTGLYVGDIDFAVLVRKKLDSVFCIPKKLTGKRKFISHTANA